MDASLQAEFDTLHQKLETNFQSIDRLHQEVTLLKVALDNVQQSMAAQILSTHSLGLPEVPLDSSPFLPSTLAQVPTQGVMPLELAEHQLVGDHEVVSMSHMAHKDVLTDQNTPNLDQHYGQGPVTPDMQLRRLMAQLTAAYNRIAELEEQLLSQKPHRFSSASKSPFHSP